MPDVKWTILPSDQLARERESWDALIATASYPPFLRSDFIEVAMEVFRPTRARLAICKDDLQIIAVALLEQTSIGRWQVYQPSQLPMGACAIGAGWTWEQVISELLHSLPGPALSVSITQQDPNFVARPSSGTRIDVLDYVPTAWLAVDGTFDAYWQSRGKNLRQNLRKQARKLEQQGEQLKFEFLVKDEDIASAFVQFAQLEAAGWKAAAGSAITADNQQGAFYQRMLQRFSQSGSAFAMRLLMGGRPIAVDFGVMSFSNFVILKTTYDESLASSSPGQLLHERAFEYLFGLNRPLTVEFYGMVMEWHTRWTDHSRMMYHTNNYRWPVVKQLRTLVKNMTQRRAARLRPDQSATTNAARD